MIEGLLLLTRGLLTDSAAAVLVKAHTCKWAWVTGYNLRHALSVPGRIHKSVMAVLKKFRPRWWLNGRQPPQTASQANITLVPPINAHYDLRPLTISQID